MSKKIGHPVILSGVWDDDYDYRCLFPLIKDMCPSCTESAIQEALERLLYARQVLQDGKLVRAKEVDNFSCLEEKGDLFNRLLTMVAEYCRTYGYKAITLPQLGLPFNLVVFRDGRLVLNLQVLSENWEEPVTYLEACGSLGRGYYLTLYPGEVLFGGYGAAVSGYPEVVKSGELDTAKVLYHETLHLKGETVAGRERGILHPREVTERGWSDLYSRFILLRCQWNRFVVPNFAEVDGSYNDPAVKGRWLLYHYLCNWSREEQDSALLIPKGRRGFERISPGEYAELVEKLL